MATSATASAATASALVSNFGDTRTEEHAFAALCLELHKLGEVSLSLERHDSNTCNGAIVARLGDGGVDARSDHDDVSAALTVLEDGDDNTMAGLADGWDDTSRSVLKKTDTDPSVETLLHVWLSGYAAMCVRSNGGCSGTNWQWDSSWVDA
jgi:hypothetical protein